MDLIRAFILGVIEGLTEFLPVSSTGHLVIASKLLGLSQDSFTKSFEIAIQLGAILAVVVVYYERLMTDFEVVKRIVISFIPTGIIGFLLYKIIKNYLLGNDMIVATSLIIGGLVLLFIDRFAIGFTKIDEISKLDYKRAIMIGLFQSIAMIPGISRSAATIIGGMFMGLTRRASAEYSFMLAIPTMFVATFYDLYKSSSTFTLSDWQSLIVGFMVSFITAFFAVKWFLSFISNNSFFLFGVYRIFAGFLYLYVRR
ncbi:MAG: undecaprenyl-diphosphate phosphatase [Thermosulfidibacteraceae bacterium]|jgi:undecaprenyl-diphosphatase